MLLPSSSMAGNLTTMELVHWIYNGVQELKTHICFTHSLPYVGVRHLYNSIRQQNILQTRLMVVIVTATAPYTIDNGNNKLQ